MKEQGTWRRAFFYAFSGLGLGFGANLEEKKSNSLAAKGLFFLAQQGVELSRFLLSFGEAIHPTRMGVRTE